MKKLLIALAGTMLATQANATVIEDFESGAFGAKWTSTGSQATYSAAAAHDGLVGVQDTGDWWYDTTDQLKAGDVLSAWFQSNSGRDYLGFGASAAGASSFVLGSNTGQILFQNNDGYTFSNTSTAAFTFATGKWYLATVTFGASIVGNVYDSDGKTLLASLTGTGLTHGANGGVALRSFGGAADTVAITNATPAVPEPATWAMMMLGFGGLGYAMRRRPAAQARIRFA